MLFFQETVTFYYKAAMKNMQILCLESRDVQVLVTL